MNEFLLPGPTLSPSLLAVLLRFREHSIAVSSDIRGVFHQVLLLPEDKALLRFLWRDLQKDKPPEVYEWQVLPFGTTCSPCCATFALQKHVQDHSETADTRVSVEKSFYVDNCLQSLSTSEIAKDHGLHWHCLSDTLSYKPRYTDHALPTMWRIYHVLASQYDPIGYIVPFTIRAKVIVQRLWDKKRDWDDPRLPEEILSSWKVWEKELDNLQCLSWPRCYCTEALDHPTSLRQIHVFCDASECHGSWICVLILCPSVWVDPLVVLVSVA